MRVLPFVAVLLAGLAPAATALADPPASRFTLPASSIEVGLRSGYALALGNASAPTRLDQLVTGQIPLWLDVGYRTPYLYVGGFLQLGFGLVASDLGCTGVCSVNDVVGGVDVQAHALPYGKLDPWLGLGVGYEGLAFTLGGAEGPTASASAPQTHATLQGWQFLDAQLGLDFHDDVVMPGIGIGPFVMVGLGRYDTASASSPTSNQSLTLPEKAIHEWVTFGVRVAYDIGLRAALRPSAPSSPAAP
jgi:hypothetical protein